MEIVRVSPEGYTPHPTRTLPLDSDGTSE